MARSDTDILNRILDPLARALNTDAARELAGLEIDAVAQRRIAKLAAKANEGTLTTDERDEYSSYIMANDLVSIMQLRARRLLRPRARR